MDQGAGQAVQGTVLLGVVGTGHVQHAVLHGDGHVGVELLRQGALGALHGDHVVVLYLNFHAGGDGDRRSTNSAHSYTLLTRQMPGLRRRHGPDGPSCRS